MNVPSLRRSVLVLGLITGGALTACVLSGDSANAAQGSGSGPCWHVGVSDWDCPDSMAVAGAEYVTAVSVVIETRDGKRITKRLPAGVDAIFLTRASTERFLLSYYWATNRDKASALARKLDAMMIPAAR